MEYWEAFIRLSPQSPIPFSELRMYFKDMKMPYTLAVFVDAIRALEKDQLDRTRIVNTDTANAE